jgi:hypothetical protein
MAILRGGIRIGGFDFRLGLPRDKTLENLENDPRFKKSTRLGADQVINSDDIKNYNPNKNAQHNIGRFQSYVNEAEGFARKARFYVEFNLPKGSAIENITDFISDGTAVNKTNQTELEQSIAFPSSTTMRAVQSSDGRRVRAFCKTINMPDRDMQMKEIRHHGPARKFVYDVKSTPIQATFYTDKYLRERTYFEYWQQSAWSTNTFNYNYYDNYVADINIMQLGSFGASRSSDQGDGGVNAIIDDGNTYVVKLFDCFPKTIGPVEYSNETNEIQTFTVTFEFRYWINYIIDRGGKVTLGTSNYPDLTYAKDPNRINELLSPSQFGGPTSRLPPELRRAGEQVLNQIKRSLPIGRITGGRVFPPFF